MDFACAGGGVFCTRRKEYLKMQGSNKSIKNPSNKTQKQTKTDQADQLENCVSLEIVVFIAISLVF